MELVKTRIIPSQRAINRAVACWVLSKAPGISIHTRKQLKSVARRLIGGEAVSPAEWKDTVYSYFASTKD